MTALTDAAVEGEKDKIYYWDTIKFLVEGCIFKVPRYQFIVGSRYFLDKLGSTDPSNNRSDESHVALEGVTASQFRVFLKLLFPIHTTSTTLKFTKEEWLVILELSTLWHFYEYRKLAKDHLEPQLHDPIERIVLGRAVYVSKWVSDGYETLVTRSECINEEESERIGHLTAVRLYILRHEGASVELIASRFREEICELEKMEKHYLTSDEQLRAAEQENRIAREQELEELRRLEKEEARRRVEEAAECARIAAHEIELREEGKRTARGTPFNLQPEKAPPAQSVAFSPLPGLSQLSMLPAPPSPGEILRNRGSDAPRDGVASFNPSFESGPIAEEGEVTESDPLPTSRETPPGEVSLMEAVLIDSRPAENSSGEAPMDPPVTPSTPVKTLAALRKAARRERLRKLRLMESKPAEDPSPQATAPEERGPKGAAGPEQPKTELHTRKEDE